MAKKSIQYSKGGESDSIFLLLSEVALGDMYVTGTPEVTVTQFENPVHVERERGVQLHKRKGLYRSRFFEVESSTERRDHSRKRWRKFREISVIEFPKDPMEDHSSYHMNEYVVYDPAQVRMRYLIQLKS